MTALPLPLGHQGTLSFYVSCEGSIWLISRGTLLRFYFFKIYDVKGREDVLSFYSRSLEDHGGVFFSSGSGGGGPRDWWVSEKLNKVRFLTTDVYWNGYS